MNKNYSMKRKVNKYSIFLNNNTMENDQKEKKFLNQ